MLGTPRDKFWPLLIATIGFDFLAAILWAGAFPIQALYAYLPYMLTALVLAQLSAIAVWLVFREQHDAWSFIVPIVSLWGGSLARFEMSTFVGFAALDYMCRTTIQTLGSVIGLWLLQRSKFWRWLAPRATVVKLEFSLRQIMVWMTAAALCFGLVARCTWKDGQLVPFVQAIGLLVPPAITIVVVIVAQLRVTWIVRIALYVAIGALIGTLLAQGRSFELFYLNLEFILEALITAIWVEWGGIIPRVSTTSTINVANG